LTGPLTCTYPSSSRCTELRSHAKEAVGFAVNGVVSCASAMVVSREVSSQYTGARRNWVPLKRRRIVAPEAQGGVGRCCSGLLDANDALLSVVSRPCSLYPLEPRWLAKDEIASPGCIARGAINPDVWSVNSGNRPGVYNQATVDPSHASRRFGLGDTNSSMPVRATRPNRRLGGSFFGRSSP